MFKKARENRDRCYSNSGCMVELERGRFVYEGIEGTYTVYSHGSGGVTVSISYDYDKLTLMGLLAQNVRGYVKRHLSGKYNIEEIYG